MSPLQSAKIVALDFAGLGKDALHVYVGLGVMFAVAIAFRLSLKDPRPLAAVLLAALAGEVWDVIDTHGANLRPIWSGNAKDVWNTMFWPTALFLLARYTRVLKR